MLNDSYLPGALLLAAALRQQTTEADLVCLVTAEITPAARAGLALLFDQVVEVAKIFVPHARRQQRQDRPYWFTRLNALRLGADGDLGFAYTKIVLLDADVLPLRHYDRLFLLNTPAGVINESKTHLIEQDATNKYLAPQRVLETGKWKWHRLYEKICAHGGKIPREITDRVVEDVTNMGVNGSLLVLEPNMAEYDKIQQELGQPSVRRLVGDRFEWPDMQYLTMRWSGHWTNVDVRFSGFNGYPSLSVLFGSHYAGFKPWHFGQPQAMLRYSRYADFQFWFNAYLRMMQMYPQLQRVKRLVVLQQQINALSNRAGVRLVPVAYEAPTLRNSAAE